jgi:hypothetical protein
MDGGPLKKLYPLTSKLIARIVFDGLGITALLYLTKIKVSCIVNKLKLKSHTKQSLASKCEELLVLTVISEVSSLWS